MKVKLNYRNIAEYAFDHAFCGGIQRLVDCKLFDKRKERFLNILAEGAKLIEEGKEFKRDVDFVNEMIRRVEVIEADAPQVKYTISKVICLCGSTKFKSTFLRETLRLTEQGHTVLSVACFSHADGIELSDSSKRFLNDLHKRKIDMADEVFIINEGGYMGDGTKEEIEYAKYVGIPVVTMEKVKRKPERLK